MAEFINGADFNGDLPDSRADAMESGSLWDFAHMYDVVRESRAAKTNVETVDEELHDHEKVKATADTLGHVKVGDNITVTDDGTISTDVNKAYVDSKLNTVNSIAPTNVEHAPSIGNNAIAFGSGVRASLQSVGVGYRASSTGASSVAIGFQPIASGPASVAIGFGAAAYDDGSVAIGSNSKAQYKDVVSVGNTSRTRRIINVTDPEVDSDAATKHYVDEKVASGSYVLPAATSTALGGVRPYGNGLVLDSDGGLHTAPATADAVGVVKSSTSITAASDGTITVNPAIFSDGLTATDAQVSVDTAFVANAIAGDGLKVINDGLAVNCGSGLIINDDKIQYESPILSWADTFPDGTFTISDGASIDSAICITSKGSTYLFKVVINFITSAAFTTGTKITIKMSGYNIKMCCLGVCGVGDVTISDTELTLTFKQDVAVNTAVKVVVL